MKYNTKTAVHVTDEFTRQNLIEFFEAIKSDCNRYFYTINSIDIGEIWFISDDGRLVCTESIHHKLNNHTIIEGIPENWRDEMGTEYKPKSIDQLIDQICQSGDMIDEFHTRDINGLIVKINQLESENKELRELLESLLKWDKKYPKSKTYSLSEGKIVDNELSEIITQAKQLLNK